MPKGHKIDCKCGVCKAKRGEYSGKNSPTYGKKWKHKTDCGCFICRASSGGFKGKTHPKYGMKTPHSKKTKAKISESLKGQDSWNKGKKCPQISGKKHWNWKGGITPVHFEIRGSFEYGEWRDKCRKRDKHTCQKCGQVGGHLEVHHIKSFASILEEYNIKSLDDSLKVDIMWNLDNGVTWCVKCHSPSKLKAKNRKRCNDGW